MQVKLRRTRKRRRENKNTNRNCITTKLLFGNVVREQAYAHAMALAPRKSYRSASKPGGAGTEKRRHTYHWELWYHDSQAGQEVDGKICQVVVRVVSAEQKQDDGYADEKLFCRRVLGSIVNLLPHIQVVICPRIELEGDSADVVEHEVGAKHVRDVDQGP